MIRRVSHGTENAVGRLRFGVNVNLKVRNLTPNHLKTGCEFIFDILPRSFVKEHTFDKIRTKPPLGGRGGAGLR